MTAVAIVVLNYAAIKITKNEYIIYGTVALSAIVYISVMFLFRVVTRQIIDDKNAIIAPCDGKIVSIEKIEYQEHINEAATKITIKTPFYLVHMKWFPINGKILQSFSRKIANSKNTNTLILQTDNHSKVLLNITPRSLSKKAVVYGREGKYAEQNDHMGFSKFGSNIELIFPSNMALKVKKNQSIKGTQTILARFINEK